MHSHGCNQTECTGTSRLQGESVLHLSELPDLFRQASNLRVGHVARVFVGHVVDQRVNFSGQVPERAAVAYMACLSFPSRCIIKSQAASQVQFSSVLVHYQSHGCVYASSVPRMCYYHCPTAHQHSNNSPRMEEDSSYTLLII